MQHDKLSDLYNQRTSHRGANQPSSELLQLQSVYITYVYFLWEDARIMELNDWKPAILNMICIKIQPFPGQYVSSVCY